MAVVVFDATGAVAGRLCTQAVKRALKGDEVAIVNAEKAVISGDPVGIVAKYAARRGIQQKANPEHSVKWPRRPDLLLKKIAAGMLPKKKSSAAKAFKTFRVYLGVPKELEGRKFESYGVKKLSCKSITIGEICARLGWKV